MLRRLSSDKPSPTHSRCPSSDKPSPTHSCCPLGPGRLPCSAPLLPPGPYFDRHHRRTKRRVFRRPWTRLQQGRSGLLHTAHRALFSRGVYQTHMDHRPAETADEGPPDGLRDHRVVQNGHSITGRERGDGLQTNRPRRRRYALPGGGGRVPESRTITDRREAPGPRWGLVSSRVASDGNNAVAATE